MIEGRYTRGKGKASAIFATKKYREATGDLIGTMNFRADEDPTEGMSPTKEIKVDRSVLKLYKVRLHRGASRVAFGWIVKFGKKKWNGIIEVLSSAPISKAFRRGPIMITCGR